jgi:hypothetical protein
MSDKKNDNERNMAVTTEDVKNVRKRSGGAYLGWSAFNPKQGS